MQPGAEATALAAEALGASLPPLLVAAERVAMTVALGVHGRRRVGQGETFWQFRRYRPGDPAQRIDWRQSARTDPLFVRETEWEAAESVWLWRDSSPSMDWTSRPGTETKRARAELLLLALAALLVRGGERVAELGRGLAPRGGRAAFARLASDLLAADLPVSGNEGGGGTPPATRLPRHARLVVFSDFLAAPEEIEAMVRGFVAEGVKGHMVQILDPAEIDLPFSGRTRFEGLEGEGTLLAGRPEEMRAAYGAELARRQAALADLARVAGWTFAIHRTDRRPETALLALHSALAGSPFAAPAEG